MADAARHRVVIVGGGFGGLFAAKFLRRAPVDVTLIDRTNHHLFQPLLYQLATAILSGARARPSSPRADAPHTGRLRLPPVEAHTLRPGGRRLPTRVW
jgi:2-polyprenyl-6-methoxyphenol hydroxylase-like FAD-dependent oxidoreductase